MYYLSLAYSPRQMLANYIGSDDHTTTTDWFAAETAVPVIVRAKCETVEKNLLIS